MRRARSVVRAGRTGRASRCRRPARKTTARCAVAMAGRTSTSAWPIRTACLLGSRASARAGARSAQRVGAADVEAPLRAVRRDCSASTARRSTAVRWRAPVSVKPSRRCARKSGRRSAGAMAGTTATIAWHTRTVPRYATADYARTRGKRQPATLATSAAHPAMAGARPACTASILRTRSAARRRRQADAKHAPRRAPPTTTRFADAMARPTRMPVRRQPQVCRFSAKARARLRPSADRLGRSGKFALGSATYCNGWAFGEGACPLSWCWRTGRGLRWTRSS